MSGTGDICARLQRLKEREQQLASLRQQLKNCEDRCSACQKSNEELRAQHRDFFTLIDQIEQVKSQIEEAGKTEAQRQEAFDKAQDKYDDLQAELEKQRQSLERLTNEVQEGAADERLNGEGLKKLQQRKIMLNKEKQKLQADDMKFDRYLSEGKKERDKWEQLVQSARSLRLEVKATKNLLDENGEMVRDNHFEDRFRKTFDKQERQFNLLCEDDRAYLRQ